MSRTIRKHIK